jgi:hypothetical protein
VWISAPPKTAAAAAATAATAAPVAVAVAPFVSLASEASAQLFQSLPIYVAAHIITFLDLAAIFSLFETSVRVRKTFRTVASAAILSQQMFLNLCPNHRINPAGTDVDAAWNVLRARMAFVWFQRGDDCTPLETCVLVKPISALYSLNDIYVLYNVRMHENKTAEQRRAVLEAALATYGIKIADQAESALCNNWIAGTEKRSVNEVAAFVAGYVWLVTKGWKALYADLTGSVRNKKFAANLSWSQALEAAKATQSAPRAVTGYDRYDSYDRYDRNVQCWRCGGYGHKRYECYY